MAVGAGGLGVRTGRAGERGEEDSRPVNYVDAVELERGARSRVLDGEKSEGPPHPWAGPSKRAALDYAAHTPVSRRRAGAHA